LVIGVEHTSLPGSHWEQAWALLLSKGEGQFGAQAELLRFR